MYGVYYVSSSGLALGYVTDNWDDAFYTWDNDARAECIVDLETGEVLWD